MRKSVHIFRHFFEKEDGQSMVEFAIVLPILLLLVCGIIEFGLFLNVKLTLNNCTREAARYAAINSNEVDIDETIKNNISKYDLLNNISVQINYSKVSRRTGDVTVKVSTIYNSVTPLGKFLFSTNHKIITSKLTMKVE